jgi:hypothetical protein
MVAALAGEIGGGRRWGWIDFDGADAAARTGRRADDGARNDPRPIRAGAARPTTMSTADTTRGPTRLQATQVIVHDLRQARDALGTAADLGVPIRLRSAPGAAAYVGVGYLHALGQAVEHEILVDCGDDAGLVMAALRTGCVELVFSGSAETFARLADMADQLGATIRHETERVSALRLQPDDDARTRCLTWLASQPNPS